MDDMAEGQQQRLTRTEASAAVTGLGWRYLHTGVVYGQVRVDSLARAADVASQAVAAAGPDAQGHLRMDLRGDRLVLMVQTLAAGAVTARDAEIAGQISAVVTGLGLAVDAGAGGPDGVGGPGRSVQVLEIAIDALDIPAVRPFWKAVLGYQDEAGYSGPEDGIADPLGSRPDHLVPADGRAPAAAQPDPLRRRGPARRGRAPDRSRARGGGKLAVGCGSARVLAAGRPGRQRGVHLHLAGQGPVASRLSWLAVGLLEAL